MSAPVSGQFLSLSRKYTHTSRSLIKICPKYSHRPKMWGLHFFFFQSARLRIAWKLSCKNQGELNLSHNEGLGEGRAWGGAKQPGWTCSSKLFRRKPCSWPGRILCMHWLSRFLVEFWSSFSSVTSFIIGLTPRLRLSSGTWGVQWLLIVGC